jgi:hypothetical protein
MSDEIKVGAAKFDRILKRMLDSPPLSKAEISARIKADREARKAAVFEKVEERRKAKRIGQ